MYDGVVDFWFRLSLRTRLGIVSSVFLTLAVVLMLSWYYDSTHFSYRQGWIIKLAPLLFLLWLAWTDLKNIPWWNWLIMILLLLVCAAKPVAWFIGIPIIGYILFTGRKK